MDILSKNSAIVDIYEYQETTPILKLMEQIDFCFKNDLCSQTTICHILACGLARNDHTLTDYLFSQETYGLREILKTCFILDTDRYVSQLEKQHRILKSQPNVNKKKLNKLEFKINDNKKMDEGMGKNSGFKLNGTKLRLIKKKWVRKVTPHALECFAMGMPMRQWQRLSDMLHIAPSDYSLDWFSEYVYDQTKAPETSLLSRFNNLKHDGSNLLEFLVQNKPEYNLIRHALQERNIPINDECKNEIMRNTFVDKYLWYWEELRTSTNDLSAINILGGGFNLEMPYGKLMERALTIRKNGAYDLYKKLVTIADDRMNSMKLNLGSVVVLGDASSSMQVAINTSSIIASILSNLCDAEIRLFRSNDELLQAPKTAQDVIDMSNKCTASGCTSPASSLWPYYEGKKHVDTFIIVTDEVENTPYRKPFENTKSIGNKVYLQTYANTQALQTSYMFAPLFKKYLEEVNPNVNLVFVSFTQSGVDGQMVREIKKEIPLYEEKLQIFKMDTIRPDLTKVDKILTRLEKNNKVGNTNTNTNAQTHLQSNSYSSL